MHTGTLKPELEACLHRDVKLRNITINPWAEVLEEFLFIIDFEDALPLAAGQNSVWGIKSGTHYFLAPEIYTHATDPNKSGVYITSRTHPLLNAPRRGGWIEDERVHNCI